MSDGSVIIDVKLNNKDFEKDINKLESVGQKGLKALATGAGIATTAIGAIGTYAIKVGSDFEAGMSKVQAISGATKDEIEKLTEKAREMGAKTKFSASESAEAFEYMAMAGWKTEDMLNGIEGIMNLAAASGENLGSVSDIVTDALTAFGLQAKDSGHFADVLAKASSNSNTNVGLMGATFKYVAPIAGSMKYSIEDTAVAIGLMANAGIKGEQAGTALRSMLTRLVKPPKEAATALDKLNISAKNSDGTMKPLSETMKELRTKFSNLTESEKASYAASIAGQEAMSGMLAIVNASDSDFEKLTQAINNSDGATKEMADTMNNNLKGATTIMKSNMESLGIAIYDKFKGPATKGINSVTEVFEKLTKSVKDGKLSKSLDKIADSFGKLIEKCGKMIEKVLPKLIEGFAWIIDHGGTIVGVVGGIVGAIKGFEAISKGAKLLEQATTTMKNLKGVLSGTQALATGASNGVGALTQAVGLTITPAGLAAAALGGLVAVMIATKGASMLEQAELKGLKKEVEDQKGAWEDLQEVRKKSLDSSMTEIGICEDLKDELMQITDENGKVKAGYEKRAEFILGKLNEALGTEYKLNGNIIGQYENLKDNIDEVIAKKKAEAILNAYQEEYATAVREQSKATETLIDLKGQLSEAQHKLLTGNYEERVEAQNTINLIGTKIKEQTNLIGSYGKTIQDYEKLQKASTEGTKEAITKAIDDIGVSYETLKETAGKSIIEQINAQQKYVDEIKRSLEVAKEQHDTYQQQILEKQLQANEEKLTNLKDSLANQTNTIKELTPEQIQAWKEVAQQSVDEYSELLADVPEETRKEIEKATGVVGKDVGLYEAFKNNAEHSTTMFRDTLKLDEAANDKIEDTSKKINEDTTVNLAAVKLAGEADTGFNSNAKGFTWGKDLTDNISSGMLSKGAVNAITGAANQLASNIHAVLGHSVPEKGPLKDELTYMPDMIDNFVKGIEKNSFKLYDASTLLAQNIKDGLNLKDINKDGEIDIFDELAIQEQTKEVADLVKKSIKTISDVNKDGEIDVFDTLAIQEQIDEMLEMFKGDVNQDGEIDVFDAVAIQEKLDEITSTVKETTKTLSKETPKLYDTIDEISMKQKAEAMVNMVKNTSNELNKQVPQFYNSIKALEEALNFDNVYNKLQQTVNSMLSMVRSLTDKISSEVLKLSNTNKMLQKEIQKGLNLNEMYKKMQASVNLEMTRLSASLTAKATLQLEKGQTQTVTNYNDKGINVTQNFYDKQATPYEQQRQVKQQMRRLTYGFGL